MAENSNSANTQAEKGSPKNGVVPPKDKRFGQPNGNKQGRGFWKKEDSARFKLERMLKLSSDELKSIASDEDAPLFERKLAACINKGDWKVFEGMINQVYGTPKANSKTELDISGEVSGINITVKKYEEGKGA